MIYVCFGVLVAASQFTRRGECRGARRVATRTATQRRGYNFADLASQRELRMFVMALSAF